MFIKFLNNIQKYLFFWILGAIVTGLGVVIFFGGYPFSPSICLLAALIMIYPSLVPLDFGKIKRSLKNYKLIIISLFINFIISPVIAIFLGYLFLQENPALWIGLILLSFLPGGGMATTWALKSKADMPSAVGIIIFNLLAAILITPLAISYSIDRINPQPTEDSLAGVCPIESVSGGGLSCGGGDVSSFKIALAVFFVVVIPLIMAYITQRIIKVSKWKDNFETVKSNFGKFSNLGLVVILFVLMGLENNSVIFLNPEIIIQAIIPTVWYYLIIIGIALFIYRRFFRDSFGKALVWGSYLRYITLALGLAISFILQDENLTFMTIPIILAYFIQIPSSFWLAKNLTDK